MKIFERKVALITGACSGIGLAVAERFAALGAAIVMADIAREAGEAIALRFRRAGAKAQFKETNVTSAADVESLVAMTLEEFGRLDYAANMAGAPSGGGGLKVASDKFERAIAVSLLGTSHCLRAQVAAMKKSGGGAIVNCSSVGGLQGMMDAPFYAAAKHGVIGLTKSAALECARHNLRVNAIAPGLTRTPMTEQAFADRLEAIGKKLIPMGRLGKPEDCAQAVTWLCSDESEFITGVVLPVDGGQSAGLMSVIDE